MTNKKLTNKEVIKSLKELSQYTGLKIKITQTLKAAIDLINRQQAEIERQKRLNSELESRETTFAKSFYKKGIADFAEIIVTDYPEMEFYLNKLVSDLAGGK